MKISELLEKLGEIQGEYGNLEVKLDIINHHEFDEIIAIEPHKDCVYLMDY